MHSSKIRDIRLGDDLSPELDQISDLCGSLMDEEGLTKDAAYMAATQLVKMQVEADRMALVLEIILEAAADAQ